MDASANATAAVHSAGRSPSTNRAADWYPPFAENIARDTATSTPSIAEPSAHPRHGCSICPTTSVGQIELPSEYPWKNGTLRRCRVVIGLAGDRLWFDGAARASVLCRKDVGDGQRVPDVLCLLSGSSPSPTNPSTFGRLLSPAHRPPPAITHLSRYF